MREYFLPVKVISRLKEGRALCITYYEGMWCITIGGKTGIDKNWPDAIVKALT